MANVVAARGRARVSFPFDPFRIVFRLLTSVRVALLLIGFVVLGALLGVIFPQAPDEVRASAQAYAAYTEFQRTRYGAFTDAMRHLGLFEVFHSYWFNGLLFVVLLAVAVCTANRVPPIVRNVRRPVRRVNDRFFTSARHRAEFVTPAEPASVVKALRRQHYRVQVTERDGATYLFADRFGWAQFGTFVSHLSLILFMSGAIVTKLVGFSVDLTIPQGQTAPVFPTIHAGQMQVLNRSAGDTPDAHGNPTRYFSNLAVFRNGKQICAGTSTVNNPMHCAGYTLHQTTFSGDGAELRVRDLKTGQVVYQEVSQIGSEGSAPNPHLVVRDASGASLFDDNVVLVPFDQQSLFALIPLQRPGAAKPIPVLLAATQGLRNAWTVAVHHPAGADPGDAAFDLTLQPGQSGEAGGLSFSIPTLGSVPLSVVQGIPGVSQAAMLQLAHANDGTPYLDLLDMGGQGADAGSAAADPADPTQQPSRLDLQPNAPQTMNGYEYTFLGQRTITGITVRKDPGSTFIWVATALMMIGLGVTFYLPRRRLWAKITPQRTYLAGVADWMVNFSAEMRGIGVAAGSPDAPALAAQAE
ncbi:MAG TPA: cytochrome c biogenesis protein ResB [Dehalococcoidia bacterium]|nr:cytochrome c biogenesis protein ResB [Dehalococcoidia bacterium]